MNKITKRIVASLSAAALIVSTFGSNSFSGTMMDSVYAEESATTSNRKGKSTGFENLEQDTNADGYYNTGYGLHTNKTASVAEGSTDGRTFDVNLESWYVGENPVDVATILDASGSMAWTVNTLDPLKIDDFSIFDDYERTHTGVTLNDITDLKNFQETNDGYLPQDVVDLILDKTQTDNSKLGYNKYKYYVYEDRSSVSEFVPLGYWDGGADPLADPNLIGYYPFSNDLKNKAPKALEDANAKGMLINHPDSGGAYDPTEQAAEKMEAEFSTQYVEQKTGGPKEVVKGLNIANSSSKGAIQVASPTTNKFSISFELSVDDSEKLDSSGNEYSEATILYLTDGTNYYRIFRGGGGSAARLKMSSNHGSPLNANKAVNTEPKNWKFTFDFDKKELTVYTNTSTKDLKWVNDEDDPGKTINGKDTYTVSLAENPQLDVKNLKIYIGGDTTECTNQNKIYIKNLIINNFTGTEETPVANYPLDKKENGLKNIVDGGEKAKFVAQAYNNDNSFGTSELTTNPLDPVFKDKKYLDVKETSKNGAVSLDAVPDIDEDGFTISMKLQRSASIKDNKQNIFYLGDKNTSGNQYYQFFRSKANGGYLALSKGKQEDFTFGDENTVYYQGGMANNNWFTNTLVFETSSEDGSKYIVTPYINGKAKYQDGSKNNFTIEKISVNKDNLVFLLCALNMNSNESEQYLDDLYVFNDALTETQVAQYFGEKESCKGSTTDKTLYHATTVGGDDIAQISESLAKNTKIDERRGWYYVNSHSTWADVTGCLASGKQYIGIRTDKGIEDYPEMAKDTATIPSEYTFEDNAGIIEQISEGDTNESKYTAPETERSIRFYVDTQNHLRCFVWSGDTTKSEDDKRTFCSLVYEKKDNQLTKYEELNNALNTFYSNLAEYSDLSNTAVVRFSTVNAVDKSSENTTDENLKKLIMKDWTNWSDAFLNDDQTDKSKYLADLLIPADGEKSTDTIGSKARPGEIQEYPYVMTGGTYTWTGLKSFYDNMVDKTDLESGNRVYDVANDARDKYLIIFTDGRDNTQDNTVDSEGNVVEGSKYKAQNYVKTYKPKDSKITKDGELAKAWADQLKAEGYTIYCVMLSTGSISPTANKEEYEGAEAFLKTLAGSYNAEEQMADLKKRLAEEEAKRDGGGEKPDEKLIASLEEQIEELENDPENHIIIVNPSTSADGGITVTDAFQQILEDIQQPRNDYTVQDYIDPRFDLVDKDGKLLKLGAGGKITIRYADGTEASTTVGNVIDNPDAYGYAYTPIENEMVNRAKHYNEEDDKEYYDDGDGEGTGRIYYDDKKDMYYLRWEDQVIPMEDRAFDTTEGNPKTLKVWSATIRLKAKDDFIGGNNILTNGNEAGENLVYSNATIENMDKGRNYELYGFDAPDLEDGKVPYRKKLEALSGTNRKINAVDAGGVSQAVYGNGIDIPSSGFPRVTVNVRLKPLNAKNLNDVIYMGEVVSPTMMLADLENDYMTGSYYLEYLERYAYRLYGAEVEKTPLLDLLNEWLKINNKDETAKTFTIPYIYLPDPVYENDKLQTDTKTGRVKVSNNTGASWDKFDNTDFEDLNLRDVTGFITYTWKRNDGSTEKQQLNPDGKYDITKEYVVKNTDQIVYNLQLKFTPLHEGDLEDFDIDEEKFITSTTDGTSDSFFEVVDNEFTDSSDESWKFTNRSEYLKAMVSEKKTYTPHVVYDSSTGKWKLLEDGAEVSDEDTYDWDTKYKKVVGVEQIEGDKLSDYYTDTPHNVGFADKDGETITDETGEFKTGKSKDDVCSLVANTTYTKDVVNGALALELVVDGRYLKGESPQINSEKEYTFTATRYYNDPYDPLPYDETGTSMNADTGKTDTGNKVEGKQYQLTFKVKENTLPENPQDGEFYTVWAELVSVEVQGTGSDWLPINDSESDNKYVGYANGDALPIGTYEIAVNNDDMKKADSQYLIGGTGDEAKYFKYLKIDNAPTSFTYDRFPENVYSVSKTAKETTDDSEYLILDGSTDNASKNIAKNNRVKEDDPASQTLTFYFGTVDERKINGTDLSNTIGFSKNDDSEPAIGNDYAKDRLGIILLTADLNNLFISKEVTNTNNDTYKKRPWEFTVTFKPNSDDESKEEFENNLKAGSFTLKWFEYKDGTWTEKTGDALNSGYTDSTGTTTAYPTTMAFTDPDSDGTYTATIYLKHNEKVLIDNLPDGKWKVIETDERGEILYSAHNDKDDVDEYTWSNETLEWDALPGSGVQFTNQFPFYILSAGGSGTYLYILCGGLLLFMASVLYYLSRLRKSKSRDKPDG